MKNQIGTKVNTPKPAKPLAQSVVSTQKALHPELGARSAPLQLSPSTLIKIEHATMFDQIAVVSGWLSKNSAIEFQDTLKVCSVSRPDAESDIRISTSGFIAVVSLAPGQSSLNCNVSFDNNHITLPVKFSSTAEEVSDSISHFALYSRDLMKLFTRSRLLSQYLAKNCLSLPPTLRNNKRSGHLDAIKTFPGFGYVAYGWAIKKSPTEFWIVNSDGHWHPLDQAVRFTRMDVSDAFADTFGPYSAEAGFLCVVKNPSAEAETPIRLVAAIDGGLFVVHEIAAGSGPQTPLSYAKWAFSLATPPSKFFLRLNSSEGDLIEYLITQNRMAYPDEFDVWKTGDIPSNPKISVIVPLFGRWDFVEYQLTRFAQDPDFKDGIAQLIYVIDDPTLVEPLLKNYHQLFKIYGIPFQLVWGKINRGYSGANNLGLKVARGRTVVLLNSDAFPAHNGWVTRMNDELLADDSVGAVGARLEYADGSVQHQGMSFEFSQELDVWLNEHPMRGLDIPRKYNTYDVEAATGACLAVRRDDLINLGGMDEGFLIGDFEDSDLCLKLRALRGRIVIAAGACLVHLERQSLINLGSNDFRTNVVKFNAWRHNRLWKTTIAALKDKFYQ